MADNIMPVGYHKTLVPMLRESGLNAAIFYEQKANLSLEQVKNLKDAGIGLIQPGIEALSTSLLQRMKKGVSASQNLALLRYARICHVTLAWNLLTHFPGDSAEPMQETLAILPKLRHLNPPTGVTGLAIDRFSPYFDRADAYGVRNLRPWEAYADVFPTGSDIANIAYHFHGDYESGSRSDPDTGKQAKREIELWRESWSPGRERPVLLVTALGDECFLLLDTRIEGPPDIRFLDWRSARAVLTPGPLDDLESQWAIAQGYALALDGRRAPLAVASYEIMKSFLSPSEAPGEDVPPRFGLEPRPEGAPVPAAH